MKKEENSTKRIIKKNDGVGKGNKIEEKEKKKPWKK